MMYTNRMTYFGSDLPYDVITNEVMVAWKTFEWRPVTALRISEHLQFKDDESDGITTVLDKVPVHVLRELPRPNPSNWIPTRYVLFTCWYFALKVTKDAARLNPTTQNQVTILVWSYILFLV
jgi:hypothetical protein